MSRVIFSLLLVFAVFILPNCKEDQKLLTNSLVFRTELFKQGLEIRLAGARGYTFVIGRNGQFADSASFGIGSINPTGNGSSSPSVDDDVNIASITKTLTAMAAISLMQEKGQLMNFPIGLWLPNSWDVHPDVASINFRQLLTHTSGLRMASTSWDSLKAVVSRPITADTTYAYANANFGLFRPILAKMRNAVECNNQEANLSENDFENWLSQRYMMVMNEKVFNPAGVFNAICDIDPNKRTLQAFCELNNMPLNPISFGNWTNLSGGGGYYLSMREIAQVLAYLVHTEQILTSSQRKMMDDNLLGWDPNDVFSTNYGTAYGKDGLLFRDSNGDGVLTPGESGLQTWAGKLPNKVEIALVVNSMGNSFRDMDGIVRQAYEDAWVEP